MLGMLLKGNSGHLRAKWYRTLTLPMQPVWGILCFTLLAKVTKRLRWLSGKVMAFGAEGSSFEIRFRRVSGLLHVKSYVVAKRPSAGVVHT
ncbi:hypothetical protein AVEN_196401-1 [Araneus ventricosus]|uniref:Uncharacterized protein n=1 Tax=Araneus ventricosus TaxID=182803 RepID=A0A4Y2AVM6_ARAVE|nr:hypothetical protein AVEN_196401-1 [Araneus ventricosus]